MSEKNYKLLSELAEIFIGNHSEESMAEDSHVTNNDCEANSTGGAVVTAIPASSDRQNLFPGDIVIQFLDIFSNNIFQYNPSQTLETQDKHAVIRSKYTDYLIVYLTSRFGKVQLNKLWGSFSNQSYSPFIEKLGEIKIPLPSSVDLDNLIEINMKKLNKDKIEEMKKSLSLDMGLIGKQLTTKSDLIFEQKTFYKNSSRLGNPSKINKKEDVHYKKIGGGFFSGILGFLGFTVLSGETKKDTKDDENTLSEIRKPVPKMKLSEEVSSILKKELLFTNKNIENDLMLSIMEEKFLQGEISDDAFKLQVLYMMKEMYKKLNTIESKIDRVLNVLQTLESDFKDIRLSNRHEEEKLEVIYSKLDRKLDVIYEEIREEIQDYEMLLRKLIVNWDKLDALSREMLPMAEYLYDQLQRIENADFSPVILQLSRSLENEMLKKLFVEFTLYIIVTQDDLDDFLKEDLFIEQTKVFAKYLLRYRGVPREKIIYSLGEMKFILELTSGKNTIRKSPLLQAFKEYINHNFTDEYLISSDYLTRLKNIVDQYRNKCAHPNKLEQVAALECKEQIPESINDLLGRIKE
jgi:hypothetical protein